MTIGSVGQLAVDLLINTLKAQLFAYLHDDTVLPVAGADPFATPGSTTTNLAASMELYRTPLGLWLLQQRAPAAPGQQRAFAARLSAWLGTSGFGKVVVLGSVPAALRRDADLAAGTSLCYAACNEALGELAVQHGCLALDVRHMGILFTSVSHICAQEALFAAEMPSVQPFPLLAAARHASLPLLALMTFASEGDNVPDAVQLADCAARVVGVFDDATPHVGALGEGLGGRWVAPPSWSHLFGRAVDVTLR